MKKNSSTPILVSEIENTLFQTLVASILDEIEGVDLPQPTMMDALFGKTTQARLKFIEVDKDIENQQVGFKIYVRLEYGFEIPKKAAMIQKLTREKVEKTTGYNVSGIHVVFQTLKSQKASLALEDLNAYEA